MSWCSLCLCAAQTGRNKKKTQRNEAGLLVGCCAGRQVSCSALSPLLLSALRLAAPSGRLGPRKYAMLVIEHSASYRHGPCIMFLLGTAAKEGILGGGGEKEEDKRENGEGVVYLGFRFSCLLTS